MAAADPPYLPRIVDQQLDRLGAAAVTLEGAKAIGKTVTGRHRCASAWHLDRAADSELVNADPEAALARPRPILIDEWQRVPAIWDSVRRAVDDGAPPDSFLLTGSVASGAETHSGAGRILRVRMRPLSLAERAIAEPTVSLAGLLGGERGRLHGSTSCRLSDYVDEIVTSGFPGLRNLPEPLRRAQLAGYLDRIIDQDFAEADRRVRNPVALRRWLSAYGAATATTATLDSIRDAATPGAGGKPERAVAAHYRDVLERLWILDPIPGWLPTHRPLSEAGSAPKHHLVDPALAVALRGLDAAALLAGDGPAAPRHGAWLGALFESLVTQSVQVYAQGNEARVAHLRTHRGAHEVDLIVERPDGRIVAIETKLAAAVTDDDVRHLRWLQQRLGPDLLDAIVVTTGDTAYRRPDGIGVVPAALLAP